jgi:hypothetical protein
MIKTAKALIADEEVGRKVTADFLICAYCQSTSHYSVYQIRIDGDHYGHFHVKCDICLRQYCLEAREVPNVPEKENNSCA